MKRYDLCRIVWYEKVIKGYKQKVVGYHKEKRLVLL